MNKLLSIFPKSCNECGSKELRLFCSQKNTSGVVDGKLRLSEVSTEFFLGCEECSETLGVIDGDKLADMITQSIQSNNEENKG